MDILGVVLAIVGILLLAGYVALCWFAAKEFYALAQAKGFSDKKYFWWCFWLGIIGYAMVIAMPDRGAAKAAAQEDELPEL